MKKVFGALLFSVSLFLCVPGCGDAGNTNVGADAAQTDLEAYQAAETAAQEEAGSMAQEVEAAAQ